MITATTGGAAPRRLTRYHFATINARLARQGRPTISAKTKAGRAALHAEYEKHDRLTRIRNGGPLPRRKGPSTKIDRDRRAMRLAELHDICLELGLTPPDAVTHQRERKRLSKLHHRIAVRPLLEAPRTKAARDFAGWQGRLITASSDAHDNRQLARRRAHDGMMQALTDHVAAAPAGLAESASWLADAYAMTTVLDRSFQVRLPRGHVLAEMTRVVDKAMRTSALWAAQQNHEAEVERGRDLLTKPSVEVKPRRRVKP